MEHWLIRDNGDPNTYYIRRSYYIEFITSTETSGFIGLLTLTEWSTIFWNTFTQVFKDVLSAGSSILAHILVTRWIHCTADQMQVMYAWTYAKCHSRAWHVLHTIHSMSWVILCACKRAQYWHVCISASGIYVPGRLHVGPLYPLGHWQVSLATHTPLPHGGSHTTEEEWGGDTWTNLHTHMSNEHMHIARMPWTTHTNIRIHIHTYVHQHVHLCTCTYTPACIF